MAFFIAYPSLAFLVAAVCAGLWVWRQRRAMGIAALGWGAYGAYELLMKARVLCSGECNIRVDLLLIYPVLAVTMLVGALQSFRGASAR